MTDLILHIGHGKTGSSYIQSVLACNVDFLRERGIDYPYDGSFNDAIKGKITSGNGNLIFKESFMISSTSLISGENLFHELASRSLLEGLILQKCTGLHVVLFTRNVFEMIISSWGQNIKRGNVTVDVNDYIKQHPDPHHERVLWWINASKEYGFKLSLRNYSKVKDNIFGVFLREILSLESSANFDGLAFPKTATVNRSLTLAEYKFQAELNKHVSGSSNYFSDCLVETLPNIRSERPGIGASAYSITKERLEPVVSEINKYMSDSEFVEIEEFENVQSEPLDEYSFSGEQLRVIAESFCRQMTMPVVDKDAETLRDIALKLERHSLRDAYSLMELALRIRPHGPVIYEKVAEYKKRII